DDRDQERRRKQEDWAQTGGERLSRRKPHDHLAIAIPARQRQQYRQKQRDRQQNVEVEQRREAQQWQNALGGNRPAGGAGEDPQDQIGEKNRQQDQKQPDS